MSLWRKKKWCFLEITRSLWENNLRVDHCILSSHDLKITVLKKIVVCLGAEGFVNSKPPLEDRNFKFALWNACTDSIQYVAEYTAQMFEYQAYEQDCICC